MEEERVEGRSWRKAEERGRWRQEEEEAERKKKSSELRPKVR